jgi:hypothetical protein
VCETPLWLGRPSGYEHYFAGRGGRGLCAVLDGCDLLIGEALVITEPLFRPIGPFNGGAIVAVQLVVAVPFLAAGGVDSRTIVAMALAVAVPDQNPLCRASYGHKLLNPDAHTVP